MERTIKTAILTVSDRCSEGKAVDISGFNLRNKLEKLLGLEDNLHYQVVDQKCCRDDVVAIQAYLLNWCESEVDLILTTGGTGIASRDVTPEAVKKILDTEIPGIVQHIISESLKITPMAILSRPVCGIIKKSDKKLSLVITLPGSTKAASECFGFVSPILGHAFDLLKDDHKLIESTHSLMQTTMTTLSKTDVSKIAKRARKSSYQMISVNEALRKILNEASLIEKRILKLGEAVGFALAEDVLAKENLPPFPASIKDGYAVLSSDGVGERIVMGESHAGKKPDSKILYKGFCTRINTGAPVPDGADAVVQVEDTELLKANESETEELIIKILKAPSIGQDIRKVGSDIKKEQKLYDAQTIVRPPEIGVLASAGVSTLKVFDKPTVALLSTGNELQRISVQPLKSGSIYDSNKEALMALLKQHSFSCIDAGTARDDPNSLVGCLRTAFELADVLVTSGGVSMGEKDMLRPVLINDFGAEIHFAQVFMKPGKPMTFATCLYKKKKKLILGLPGNPVSALVTSQLFLLPLLRQMSGFNNSSNTVIRVKLGRSVRLDPRPEYQRMNLSWSGDEDLPLAQATGDQISSRLLSFSSAQALVQLPPATDDLKALESGTIVSAILLVV